MKTSPLFALLILIVLTTGCNSMKATSERDEAFDFSQIQTYQWIDGPEEILNKADTYIHEDIRQALNTELVSRGLREVSDAADVQVAYYVKLREEIEYTDPAERNDRDFSGGFVYTRDGGGWSYAEREPDLNIYTVEIGTLTVLVYDAETGERVWRGTLQTELDRSRPKEKKEARIRKAAGKLIGRLPATSS